MGLCLLAAVVFSQVSFGGARVYDQYHKANGDVGGIGYSTLGRNPVVDGLVRDISIIDGLTVAATSGTSLFGASATKLNTLPHITLETGFAHASSEFYFVSDYLPDFTFSGMANGGAKVHIELEDRTTGDIWEKTVKPMNLESFCFDDIERLNDPGDFRMLMDVIVERRTVGLGLAEVRADFGDVLVEVVPQSPVPVPGSLLLTGIGLAFVRKIKKSA